MNNIFYKTLAISIILLLIGVSVSSATTNVVKQSLINDNQPPTPPDICGPSEIPVGEYVTFSFNSVDPDGDNVSYLIECDDGTSYGWTDYIPSGQDIEVAHKWEEKPLYIKAKAKDYPFEAESNWSYHYFRSRSRNLESNNEEDCGCGEISDVDLIKLERLLNRVEVYSKLLLVLSKYNPELREVSEELLDIINSVNLWDFPIICSTLGNVVSGLWSIHESIISILDKYSDFKLLHLIISPFGTIVNTIWWYVYWFGVGLDCWDWYYPPN